MKAIESKIKAHYWHRSTFEGEKLFRSKNKQMKIARIFRWQRTEKWFCFSPAHEVEWKFVRKCKLKMSLITSMRETAHLAKTFRRIFVNIFHRLFHWKPINPAIYRRDSLECGFEVSVLPNKIVVEAFIKKCSILKCLAEELTMLKYRL